MVTTNKVDVPELIRYWGRSQKVQSVRDVQNVRIELQVRPDKLPDKHCHVCWEGLKTFLHQECTGEQGVLASLEDSNNSSCLL